MIRVEDVLVPILSELTQKMELKDGPLADDARLCAARAKIAVDAANAVLTPDEIEIAAVTMPNASTAADLMEAIATCLRKPTFTSCRLGPNARSAVRTLLGSPREAGDDLVGARDDHLAAIVADGEEAVVIEGPLIAEMSGRLREVAEAG